MGEKDSELDIRESVFQSLQENICSNDHKNFIEARKEVIWPSLVPVWKDDCEWKCTGQTQEQLNYTLSVLSDTFDTTAADLGKHGNHLAAAFEVSQYF